MTLPLPDKQRYRPYWVLTIFALAPTPLIGEWLPLGGIDQKVLGALLIAFTMPALTIAVLWEVQGRYHLFLWTLITFALSLWFVESLPNTGFLVDTIFRGVMIGCGTLALTIQFLKLVVTAERRRHTELNHLVPIVAEAALYFFLGPKEREALPGDLEEEYRTIIVPKFGVRFAKVWYWKQVAGSILPLLFRRTARLATFGWVVDLIRRRF